jgi:molybdenum cofactor cytidylyltransferase
MPAPDTLLGALALAAHECVAIVGGGGKTTIMYRLAAESQAAGRTAVVGGTTRFTPPRAGDMPPVVLVKEGDNTAATVRASLRRSPVVTCASGRGDKGRWLPISPLQVEQIAAIAELDLIALEADGSRNRPFKAPGDNEPVIPAAATMVLCVVGLDVIGKPMNDEWVHRPERVASLTGAHIGDTVTPECVARLLLHPEGGRKGVPDAARWIPLLNKAEPERWSHGLRIARLLLSGGAPLVVLATAGATRPVVSVLRG